MAKSKARKKLESKIRQGKMDPRNSRLNWNGINPVTKSIPNKKKDIFFDKMIPFDVKPRGTYIESGSSYQGKYLQSFIVTNESKAVRGE